ncbi:hypothetical protein, partial [Fusobacterium sp.]|uniref:hypothetical protein n=1 Tax=Fusobacterium sp. TaxID=68766 RepID=UPI00262CDA4A
MLEENLFKSCLKRKVTFTTSTLVKFLITGTIAFSLTACGGGGGGSSSSEGNNINQKPTVENTSTVSKEFIAEKQNFINSGNIALKENKKDSVVGILGKNSNITNNSLIEIKDKESSKVLFSSENGKDILDLLQKNGKSLAIFDEKGNILNNKEGKINITGHDVIGIAGLYSNITNEGKIFTTNNIQDTKNAIGIMTMGGNVVNNGDIILASYDGTGIIAYNNGAKLDNFEINSGKRIAIINNGNIIVNGEESRGIVAEGTDIDITNNGKLSLSGIDVDGIVVKGNNISIVNNTNGKIEIINKEQKELKNFEYISGINIKEGNRNIITNKGNINISIENEGKFIASGIYADEKTSNTKITNEGYISIKNNNKIDNTPDDELINEEYLSDFSYGIKSNSEIINEKNGTIEISGSTIGMRGKNVINNGTVKVNDISPKENNTPEYKTSIGIVVGNNSFATNNGSIILEGSTQGIFAFNNSEILNNENGVIEITNGFEASALSGIDSNIINKGTLNLSGTYANGIEIFKGSAENHNKININSNSSCGIFVKDIGTAFNKKNGVIDINSKGSYGILLLQQNPEVSDKNTTIAFNENIININGENSYGISAQTTNEKTKDQIGAKAENSKNATINVNGKNSIALEGVNGDLVNKGDINLLNEQGTGIKISGTGFGDNYGLINLKGNNSSGMLALDKGTVTNEKGGIINIEGNNSSGILALNNGIAI